MRVALISDIHGNSIALDTVLADLDSRAVDRVVCLGDVVAMGPRPRESLARLQSLDCALVMGNTDRYRGVGIGRSIDDDTLRFAVALLDLVNELTFEV